MRLKQLYVSKLFRPKRKISLLYDSGPEFFLEKESQFNNSKDRQKRKKQQKKKRTRGISVQRSWCRRQLVVDSHQQRNADVPSTKDGLRAPVNSDEDDEPAVVNRKCSLHSSQYSSSFDNKLTWSSSTESSSFFVSHNSSPCSSSSIRLSLSSAECSPMKLEARAKAWDCQVRKRQERCDAVPVRVLSSNPYKDFKDSMAEMIVKHRLFRAVELQQLLDSYLGLNSPASHGLIIKVFADICLNLYS